MKTRVPEPVSNNPTMIASGLYMTVTVPSPHLAPGPFKLDLLDNFLKSKAFNKVCVTKISN